MSRTLAFKLLIALIISFNQCHGYSQLPQPLPGTNVVSLQMPKAAVQKGQKHICTAFKLEDEKAYISYFEVAEMSEKAHQLMLHGCSEVPSEAKNSYWDCNNHRICSSSRGTILFAWANNATNINMPASVGFQVGGSNDKNAVRYLVLQVSYDNAGPSVDHSALNIHVSSQPTEYLAKILTVAGSPVIPPQQEKVHTDVCCPVTATTTLNIIAASVHSHSLGVTISAYKYNPKTGTTTEIIKGNPQSSQAYVPTLEPITIANGDLILARCTYNSLTRNKITYHGTGEEDEMCNVHVMYYTAAAVAPAFQSCGYVCGGQTAAFPRLLLPPNPVLQVESVRESLPGAKKTEPLVALNQITDSAFSKGSSMGTHETWSKDAEIYSDFLLPCVKDLQK